MIEHCLQPQHVGSRRDALDLSRQHHSPERLHLGLLFGRQRDAQDDPLQLAHQDGLGITRELAAHQRLGAADDIRLAPGVVTHQIHEAHAHALTVMIETQVPLPGATAKLTVQRKPSNARV
ncbi:hypothetical protein D3C78_903840 [compost metagenome]